MALASICTLFFSSTVTTQYKRIGQCRIELRFLLHASAIRKARAFFATISWANKHKGEELDVAMSEAALWVGAVVVGPVAIGVATNALWDWIKEHVSLSLSWPRIRGNWVITHPDSARQAESVVIQQQFGAKFRGELRTADPTQPTKQIVQVVRGEFLVDRTHALFRAFEKNGECMDITTGMLSLHAGHRSATGKSVFFGVTAESDLTVAAFDMVRTV